jgi:hypothetical protein
MKKLFFRSLIVDLDTSRLSISQGRWYTANALTDKEETHVASLAFGHLQCFWSRESFAKNAQIV